jgi:hypothetical protein
MKINSLLKVGRIFLMLALLSGCSDPLPKDKLHYAGEWQSKEMYVLILEDGTVDYKRLKRGGTTSVNGPLKEFQGDNFVVGIGPMTTMFKVSKPPHQVEGQWLMEVDGVLLKRTQ